MSHCQTSDLMDNESPKIYFLEHMFFCYSLTCIHIAFQYIQILISIKLYYIHDIVII